MHTCLLNAIRVMIIRLAHALPHAACYPVPAMISCVIVGHLPVTPAMLSTMGSLHARWILQSSQAPCLTHLFLDLTGALL